MKVNSSIQSKTYIFGFRIPFLPDFLLDHTLLEKEPHERIAEHCRRRTQFIAGLWREETITFALVFEWSPQPKMGLSPKLIQLKFPCLDVLKKAEWLMK